MKILFMISSLEPGGAERVLTQLANYWVDEKGHDVHIMILREEGSQSFYPLSQKITLHYAGQLKQDKIFNLTTFKKVAQILLGIRKKIKTLQPDRVISFTELMNIVMLLITRSVALKVPLIISERIDPHAYKIGMFFEILRRVLYPFANKLVVQGRYILPYFSYMKSKVVVIPNPVRKIVEDIDITKQKKIISVGRLAKQKNHSTLIKAFAKIVKKYPDYHLEVYGQGPEKDNLEKLIKSLGVEDKICLKGISKNIISVLQKRTIFVFPSLYEGFPNALAEAMSVGLPVIVSDCGGNLELVRNGENGLVFPAKNVELLKEKLETLMQNPQERKRLGGRAQCSVKSFSPEKIYAQWDRLIEEK